MITAGDASICIKQCKEGAAGQGWTHGCHNSRDGGGCVGAGHPKHPPSSLVGWLGREPCILWGAPHPEIPSKQVAAHRWCVLGPAEGFSLKSNVINPLQIQLMENQEGFPLTSRRAGNWKRGKRENSFLFSPGLMQNLTCGKMDLDVLGLFAMVAVPFGSENSAAL